MPPLLRVHEATLRNGLRVRVVPSTDTPVVSLYTFFQVGSRNERPGLTGISHLFEHMMFNGAKKYGPHQFDEVLEAHGGRSNAYTSHDLTVYYEEFASEALEQVLDLEADRMRSLAISDRMLEREREVVKEERRLRVDNEVMGLIDEELQALVYQAHPYRWPVIGWMGDIEAIRRQDCEAYFRTYYAPSNAVLWIAGDVEPEATVARVRKAYGNIPRGPPVPAVVNAEPTQRGERRSVLSHPAQAPGLLVAYRGPPVSHPDAVTLDVLEFILAVGEGSRLNKRLVYEEKVAVDVGMDWSWRLDPGVLLFHAELAPAGDPASVEAALYRELARVVEHGVTQRELDKAKNNLRAHLMRELTTSSGRAHALGSYEAYLGSWRAGLRLAERYASADAASVQAVAARYLLPSQRSVVTLVPGASA
ncbi:MAG: M16 family metallopeptidase [Myxococcaceae bacterium]